MGLGAAQSGSLLPNPSLVSPGCDSGRRQNLGGIPPAQRQEARVRKGSSWPFWATKGGLSPLKNLAPHRGLDISNTLRNPGLRSTEQGSSSEQ